VLPLRTPKFRSLSGTLAAVRRTAKFRLYAQYAQYERCHSIYLYIPPEELVVRALLSRSSPCAVTVISATTQCSKATPRTTGSASNPYEVTYHYSYLVSCGGGQFKRPDPKRVHSFKAITDLYLNLNRNDQCPSHRTGNEKKQLKLSIQSFLCFLF
jgi:hypothetical protein